MTKEEVLEIIRNENLRYYNWFDDHRVKPEEVVIRQQDNNWIVYTSSERAAPVSEVVYESESDALQNFVKRLRGMNKYKRSYE